MIVVVAIFVILVYLGPSRGILKKVPKRLQKFADLRPLWEAMLYNAFAIFLDFFFVMFGGFVWRRFWEESMLASFVLLSSSFICTVQSSPSRWSSPNHSSAV